jgi:hypothetical protein
MNPDKTYGYQCKDVIDDYVMAIFPGTSWVNTIRPGDAKVCFDNSNPEYFEKIRYSQGLIPRRGDIIVWNGNLGGGAGHIAVIEGASASGFDVIEQNGLWVTYDANGNVINPGKPAYRQHYTNYGNVIGTLRPKLNDNQGTTAMSASQDKVDETSVQLAYNNGLFRAATPEEVAARVNGGETEEHMQRDIASSKERAEILRRFASYSDLAIQAQTQQATIDSLNKQLDTAEAERDSALEDVEALQAKIDAQPPKDTTPPSATPETEPTQAPTWFAGFVEWLKSLIKQSK